jgi:hypothetical protein
MLNQLLKFTLLSSLLLWLRPRWRSLLALVTLIVLVHVLHGEYLGYVELSQDRSFLVWSYFIKWFFLIAGVLVYLSFAVGGSAIAVATASGKGANKEHQAKPSAVSGDGFDFLRNKKYLQSRAEKILAKDSPEDG